MRNFILALAMAFLVMAGAVVAEDSILRPDHPDRYVVKKGDTLWGIASMFLTDAWHWPEIWHVNPDIENPHLIFPGDEIVLSFVEGEPRLTLERGQTRASRTDTPLEKLKPQVRAEMISSAIPAIPLDAIASLLTSGRIVGPQELEQAPYVMAGEGRRIVMGAGDKFYARGDWTDNNSAYGVFRKGDTYTDPETGEVLGLEAREVGLAQVVATDGDLLTMRLTSTKQEVRIGDRLLPTEERRVESTFYPAAPDGDVTGVIMTVVGGATHVGRNDLVAVNRGTSHGLDVGHVLGVHKAGGVIRDRMTNEMVRLPDERAGLMMVFRSFDKMAYALILSTEEPLRAGDTVRNP